MSAAFIFTVCGTRSLDLYAVETSSRASWKDSCRATQHKGTLVSLFPGCFGKTMQIRAGTRTAAHTTAAATPMPHPSACDELPPSPAPLPSRFAAAENTSEMSRTHSFPAPELSSSLFRMTFVTRKKTPLPEASAKSILFQGSGAPNSARGALTSAQTLVWFHRPPTQLAGRRLSPVTPTSTQASTWSLEARIWKWRARHSSKLADVAKLSAPLGPTRALTADSPEGKMYE